ncbi:MAG: ExbD/TolR family protein [bacterium]
MIRLIDLVFILLFGFISISEVSEKTKVELPKSTETPLSNPDREQVCFVGIDRSGLYLVENESTAISGAQALYTYLRKKVREAAERREELRVRIRSNWDTPIKYTMAAADICDNLGIVKGIDVRRISDR